MQSISILLPAALLAIAQPIEPPQEIEPPQAIVSEAEQDTAEEVELEEYYDSLELLAICVEAEAGNQGLYGKRLVADVILNRVDSDRFPDTVEGVITQKHQFSSYTDGGMAKVTEPTEETFEAIQLELDNRTDSQILFFTAGRYNSHCTPAYKYGDHYFGY